MEIVLAAMRDKAKHWVHGQETETGASEQLLSNKAACFWTWESQRRKRRLRRSLKLIWGTIDIQGRWGLVDCVGRQDDTQHKRREGALAVMTSTPITRSMDLQQVQQETLRMQQAMLQTFKIIHVDFCNYPQLFAAV
nr:uncharacterized protein LOC129271905 [Lytechinus pictus]